MPHRERKAYQIGLGLALGVGFALGYTLKQGAPPQTAFQIDARGALEADFPGCARQYRQIKQEWTWGDYVRVDYRAPLGLLEKALASQPGYLPFQALRARIYEDWYTQARREGASPETLRALAEQLGLAPDADAATLAEHCRQAAVACWEETARSPMYADVQRYGPQWRALRQQHLNALTHKRTFQVEVQDGGFVDLTPAFDRYGITVDQERYVSNLSDYPAGPTFAEKNLPDVLYCPQHREVGFQFPNRPYLTTRQDLEFFYSVMGVDNQKLDLRDVVGRKLHLLCFNVSQERRPVKALVRLEYADHTEYGLPIVVGPWRQTPALLRDPAARRKLDPAYRADELHRCNGLDLEGLTSPAYMYHVSLPLKEGVALDKIGFPRHDPAKVGLEDPGISDLRIVAVTVQ